MGNFQLRVLINCELINPMRCKPNSKPRPNIKPYPNPKLYPYPKPNAKQGHKHDNLSHVGVGSDSNADL